jgi:hypothetical protein
MQDRSGGWLYSVHFVLDDLLTTNEIRDKVRQACHILLSCDGKGCTWEAYLEELDRWEVEDRRDEIQQALDELEAKGLLYKTGEFRKSSRGQLQPVYAAVSPDKIN